MFHVYTVVGGASLVAHFFSIASCQLTSIVTNQGFQIKSIPSPTLFRIVLCHKLDVHAGVTIHVKIVLLNSCGFVELVLFSLGKKVNHVISIKLGNRHSVEHCTVLYGARLNELPE